MFKEIAIRLVLGVGGTSLSLIMLENFWPVSNLPFLGKVLEQVMLLSCRHFGKRLVFWTHFNLALG